MQQCAQRGPGRGGVRECEGERSPRVGAPSRPGGRGGVGVCVGCVCARAFVGPATRTKLEVPGSQPSAGRARERANARWPRVPVRASVPAGSEGGESACLRGVSVTGDSRPAQGKRVPESGWRVPGSRACQGGGARGPWRGGVVARGREGAGRQGKRGRGTRARAAERAPAVTWARDGGRERAREGGGWGG